MVKLCKNGHKLVASNVREVGGHKGKYVKCRICANKAAREYAARKRDYTARLENELEQLRKKVRK